MHKQNNLPVVVLILNNEEFDKTNNPFDNDTQIMLFENLKNEFSFLEACFSINSSTLDSIFNILRPAYEPVLIGYCKDNKYLIETQINDKETRIALNVFDNFNGFEAAIKNEDESAEKVRKSLYLDNEILYKAQVPESLYIQYEILKNIMNEAK